MYSAIKGINYYYYYTVKINVMMFVNFHNGKYYLQDLNLKGIQRAKDANKPLRV